MRVVFPSDESNARSSSTTYSRSICINPTAIACAKYHNVAITADGRVYSWGLHKETLGIEKSPTSGRKQSSDSDWATASEFRRPRSNSQNGSNSSSVASISSISSPQLVSGMLPENGGGKAIAVSASESHTAIVTSDGHLFTWGTSHGNDVLGHKGVKWQPSPRKVKRVHRAVGVAAAKEHTALLMATSFPTLPKGGSHHVAESPDDAIFEHQPPSLQEHAAIEISRNVDMFNVVPVALVAHRLNCQPLMKYCDEFISKNLDGVLAVGNKNDFTSFLTSKRTCVVGETRSSYDCDGTFHPFLYHLANSEAWAENAKVYSRSITIHQLGKKKYKKKSMLDHEVGQQLMVKTVHDEKEKAVKDPNESNEPGKKEMVKTNRKLPSRPEEEIKESHTLQVPKRLFPNEAATVQSKSSNTKVSTSKYHCTVCNISCPDDDSYTLHMNGRKHRNRLLHARADEEKKIAESMMAMKQMQLMEKNNDSKPALETKANTPKSAWGVRADPNAPKEAAAALAPKSKARARSKSFQQILNEEQQKSTFNTNVKSHPDNVLTPPTTKQRPVLRNTIAAATCPSLMPPTAYSTPGPPVSSPGPSLPLSAFMKKSGEQKKRLDTMSRVGASWGAKPSVTNGNDSSGVSWGSVQSLNRKSANPTIQHATSSKAKSFSEIQQEEEAFRSNEDHMCRIDGNQWFVQQRERAASIGEIQEQEAKDREMQDMIEEQKQIEKEIKKRVNQEKKKKKREDTKEKQQQMGKGQKQQHQKKKNKNKNRQEKMKPKEQVGGGDSKTKPRKKPGTAEPKG